MPSLLVQRRRRPPRMHAAGPLGRPARDAEPPAQERQPRVGGSPAASLSPLVILVVDDDPFMTDMLPRKLRKLVPRLPMRILTAATPEEAERIIDAERPHVVLSDYNLRSARTGLDVLAHAEETHPDAVRILFTGHAKHEISPALDERRLHGFLEKPFRLDDMLPPLVALLERALGVPPEEGDGRDGQ